MTPVTAGGGRSFTGALIQNVGAINVGISWTANTAIDQAGQLTIASGTTTLSGLLRLFQGSTSFVQTQPPATFIRNGGCQTQGGTANFACP